MSSEMNWAVSQWNADQLRAIWSQLQLQVNPFVQVLCLDGNLYRMLDTGAKNFIAQNFINHVKESVLYCIDGTGHDRVFLGAPRHFVTGGGMLLQPGGSEPFWVVRSETKLRTPAVCSPSVSAKTTKIPRPPNAYILYRKERHNTVKDANPGITNNEISQILGRAWNLETRDVRQRYKDMADRVKQALLEKHPDYQYKPRKPSEKKRRTRKGLQTQAPINLTKCVYPMSSPESDIPVAASPLHNDQI
uniref:Mating type 2 HMG1/2 protein n=6 Tax=Epichloe TaxID=5112 RepID=A0A513WX44_9HYPO|nr:mating type 2 HMG1/2 protein [Epichloe cabralii]QDH06194.1 mating type 2 HMG1/2 protein [Epichloe cabralii]QDH06213.1 mating type 2 HMG1/2 protein [Epichloe chisosa]QDH06238.1 mating type 2 HMG1/2 protein [Epichloe typhina subsp. poae]